MSVIFLILKLYPFIGVSMSVLSVDLFISFRRKGSKLWILMMLMGAFFIITTLAWLIMRGDQNAEIWFNSIKNSLGL